MSWKQTSGLPSITRLTSLHDVRVWMRTYQCLIKSHFSKSLSPIKKAKWMWAVQLSAMGSVLVKDTRKKGKQWHVSSTSLFPYLLRIGVSSAPVLTNESLPDLAHGGLVPNKGTGGQRFNDLPRGCWKMSWQRKQPLLVWVTSHLRSPQTTSAEITTLGGVFPCDTQHYIKEKTLSCLLWAQRTF